MDALGFLACISVADYLCQVNVAAGDDEEVLVLDGSTGVVRWLVVFQ